MMVLLTLPALELAQYLRTYAETNVILEVLDPESETVWDAETETPPDEGSEPATTLELSGEAAFEPGSPETPGGADFEPDGLLEPRTRSGEGFQADRTATRETLLDYLLWQLDLMPLTAREQPIAWALVEGLDQDGYLTLSDDELIAGLDPVLAVTAEEIQVVQRSRTHPQQHLARSWLRLWRLFEAQHLRAAVRMHANRFHDAAPPLQAPTAWVLGSRGHSAFAMASEPSPRACAAIAAYEAV
jgi:hypothetical protein